MLERYIPSGYVTQNFYNQGLTKIPSLAFKRKDTEVLNLRFNNIKNIPHKIGILENLKILDLSWNNLKVLPSSLAECENLTEIYLIGNKFENWPTVLFDLENLEKINISDNLLSRIPSELCNCKNLRELILWKNNITNIPIEFYSNENLIHLDISYNKLFSLRPEIKNLKSLHYLNINDNQLDDLPFEICELNLKVLKFQRNPFRRSQQFKVLSKDDLLVNLKELYLSKDDPIDFKTVRIPKELVRPISKYLSFFKEYVLVTKGAEILFDIEEAEESLTLITDKNGQLSSDELEEYLYEYINMAQQNLDNITLNVKTNITAYQADMLILELKSEVRSLKSLYEIAQLKNKKLEEDNDFLRQLSLKLSSRETHFSINSLPASSGLNPLNFDFSLLLTDLYGKAIRMTERKYSKKLEDLHNDEFTDFLRDRGYIATDQTRSGRSNKNSGELDIMIRGVNGIPISIIEAFRLSSCGGNNNIVSQHIYKLLNDYDTAGHKTNFIIIYSEAKNFISNWENYSDYLEDLNNQKDFEKSKYPLIRFVDTKISRHTDIKIGVARHLREKETVTVYHIFINMYVS